MKKIFLPLCILLLAACSRPSSVKHINSALVSGYTFKPGTYWIFRDSVSGRIDSFYVTDCSSSSAGASPVSISGGGSYSEQIAVTIGRSILIPGGATTDTQGMAMVISGDELRIYYTYSHGANINFGNIDDQAGAYVYLNSGKMVLEYPFVNGYSYPQNDTEYTNVSMTYTVAGVSYSGVTDCIVRNTINVTQPIPSSKSFNDDLAFAPKIGMIKMVLDHPEEPLFRVWELQRKHVVQ